MNLLGEDPENQSIDLINLQEEVRMIPNIDFYNTIVVNEFMQDRIVDIRDGEVVKEGYITKYKLYVVRTRSRNNPEWETEVSRRFSDFEWLYSELVNKYGGYIIPSLPEKHLLTKVNLESYEFSEKRRKELQNFLQRIHQHPQLRYVPELRIFIEDKEKFISLLKGELEQNKTLEQKYENLMQSLKTFFIWPNSNVVTKPQDITKIFDSEKDLTQDESALLNLSIKCSKLKSTVEDHLESLRSEIKFLNEQNDALYNWNGLNTAIEDNLRSFGLLKQTNEQRIKKINRFIEDVERQFLPKLAQNLNEIEWALLACKRKRLLSQQLVVDQQRIEELKMMYTENTSRRDIEMDILKTKYQKNKDRSDKMSLIMNEEVSKFVSETKNRMKEVVEKWKSLMAKLSEKKVQDDLDS